MVAYLSLFLALGGGAAYAANEFGGGNIRDESLTGNDIKNGSLRQADLSTVVRSARQDSRNTCGRTTTLSNCVSVPIDLARPQRLLLIASGEWESAAVDDAEGECSVRVDGGAARGARRFGELDSAPSSPFNFAINTSTGNIAAGDHRVILSCKKVRGSMRPVKAADLTVVAVGDG